MLTLLQNNQLSIPQPQLRPATERSLLPAEHNTLNQMVTKLAAATGESTKLIWQSMLELSGVKAGELIPAKQFPHLVTGYRRARRSAPTAPLPCIPFRLRLNSRWNRTSSRRFGITPSRTGRRHRKRY